MQTIGDILDKNRGIGPGFDALRVGLSFAVILWHCFALSWGSIDAVKASPGWAFGYAILPMFFALSGFLVTGSALRLSLGKFVASRILRIVPALAVDTLVTVLILGPLLTALPLAVYFAEPGTWAYLLNIVGEIHFQLPGMFEANPYPDVVNGSLWTIPPELGCYVVMAGLMLVGWIRRWPLVALVAIGVTVVLLAAQALPSSLDYPGRHHLAGPAIKLVLLFVLGSLAFLLARRIPYSPVAAAACVLMLAVAGFAGSGDWFDHPAWVVLTAAPLCYLMAFIGVTRLPRLPLFGRGDYSYGIYLYGFPIQQAIVQILDVRDPLLLFALCVVPVTLLAMFSWHVVEKPTLRLRKGFSFAGKVERQREIETAQADADRAAEGTGTEAVATGR